MTFQEKAEELFQEVCRARAAFEAWWGLTRKDWESAYPDALEPFSEYFGISVHSHFVSMLLALHRIYDRHPDALSIPNLERSMQSEARICPALRTATGGRLAQAATMLAKVDILRDKLFGHRDRAYSIERAFGAANITGNELRDLITLSLETLNPIVVACGGGHYEFDNAVEQDVNEMLRTLQAVQQQRPNV